MSTKYIYGGIIVGLVIAGVAIFFTTSREAQELKSLAAQFPNWVQVSGTLAPFDVRFPKEPKYVSQDLPVPNSNIILKQEVYSLDDEGSRYTVGAVVYPSDISGDVGDNLHDALEGMVKSIPGAVLVKEERQSTNTGTPYVEFSIKENEMLYKGRLRMMPRTLLQIIMESSEKSFNHDVYSYFVAAFTTH